MIPFDERGACLECGGRLWSARCQRTTCPAGARHRAADERTRRRRLEVRQPPRLPYTADGTCRLCGGDVVKPRRTWCSQRCVDVWWMATSSDHARAHLVAFYPGCWECGARDHLDDELRWVDVGLAVDHVVPLWSLSDEERTELRWWLPFNLQLLCKRCHDAKTANEAAVRALLRRIVA